MKPEKPRKNPALKPSRRRIAYPREVLGEKSNVEFLRSIADICNARADEVEQAEGSAQ
jgi:hypothetical protein